MTKANATSFKKGSFHFGCIIRSYYPWFSLDNTTFAEFCIKQLIAVLALVIGTSHYYATTLVANLVADV